MGAYHWAGAGDEAAAITSSAVVFGVSTIYVFRTPIEGAMARMDTQAKSCKLCSEEKPITAFYESSLKKSFPAWCKPCHIRMITERRRGDPAARLRTRAYMRERRAGRALAITIRDIRSLLAKEDEQSIRQDILSLERMREDEPLDVQNAILVKKVKPKEEE